MSTIVFGHADITGATTHVEIGKAVMTALERASHEAATLGCAPIWDTVELGSDRDVVEASTFARESRAATRAYVSVSVTAVGTEEVGR